jgi:thiol-disulfide isomerase/thioredoxin
MTKTRDQLVKPRRRPVIWGAALLVGVMGLAFYYVATEFPIAQPESRSAPAAALPGATSDEFAFSFFDQPRRLSELSFVDGEGRARSIADFKGKPVLLNIWATWCAPCRKEMPSLDRLQARYDPSQLVVVPLSVDRQGLPAVKKLYDELGLRSIGIFLDWSGATAGKVNAAGLPTTLFIDRDGREIGRKAGPAEWDSAEVVAVVREHLGLMSTQMGNR